MKKSSALSTLGLVGAALLASGCSRLRAQDEIPPANIQPEQNQGQPRRTIGERVFGDDNSASRRELPAGTSVQIRLAQDIDSGTANVGDDVEANVTQPITIDDAVVIPAGARVVGEVDVVQPAKHFGGQSMVSVRFTQIAVDGGHIEVTGSLSSEGHRQKGKDTAIIAGSAAGGAILGKVIGGDTEDAAAGAVVGGGIGTAVASKKGDEALLPAGTVTSVVTDRAETVRRVD